VGQPSGEPGRHSQHLAPDATLGAALERAVRGDEDAFRDLYRAVQPRLLNFLRSLVGEADAEDVASEAWARIARDLRSFNGTVNGFRAWAVTIARHRAVDHLRRQRPGISLSLEARPPTAHDDVERDAIEGITTASALAMIGGLPPDQAQAILLRVIIGLDAASAGQVLGKRPGAVRTATYRGLRNLARRLQQATSDADKSPATPSQHGV
jgi:RNA polymerase sigma-70 factor (ECF subfamily)